MKILEDLGYTMIEDNEGRKHYRDSIGTEEVNIVIEKYLQNYITVKTVKSEKTQKVTSMYFSSDEIYALNILLKELEEE